MRTKKEIPVPKVDFAQLLQRRGLSVKTWLEREGFVWQAQVNLWISENSGTYTFSDDFHYEIEKNLVEFEPEPVVFVAEPKEIELDITEHMIIEDEEEESSSKKRKRSNKVQNDPETL
ncbi:MAG: hypothetical protein AABY22_34600 [Nanoarchaeota archaeon]